MQNIAACELKMGGLAILRFDILYGKQQSEVRGN